MKQVSDMGRISFDYLPANPLHNGWVLSSPGKPTVNPSVPPDRPDGLRIKAEDAIDHDVEKYQRVCNHVRFSAKLSEHSYAYVRVRMSSQDSESVSKMGWIACDVGARAPRKESSGEWVIYREPANDGWAEFDLLLPAEVERTFGQDQGLKFMELIGIRLRGSISVSPISLFREVSTGDLNGSAPVPDDKTNQSLKEPWSRGQKIAMVTLLVTFLSLVALFFIPEGRRILRLENKPVSPQSSTSSPVVEAWKVKLTAETAKDLDELRKRHYVTRLGDAESEKTFGEIPSNTYGYVMSSNLMTSRREPVLPINDVRIETINLASTFEVHKMFDGTPFLVGFVGPETFARLREGVAEGTTLTLYSRSWKDAPNLVSLLLSSLACTRYRSLDTKDEAHRSIDLEALDCSTR
jgi:hypothetical protein